MKQNHKRVKYACYTVGATMSIVANMPPVLFMTFRSVYGISYTLLGLLILANFVTQLLVDLAFSFFSHRFNIPKVVKSMPYLTFSGLFIYCAYPLVFPDSAYFGLLSGTLIFSAASGLAEVLISPIVAAIPSDDPDREMSRLHSVYAWCVIPVVIITSLYLLIFKNFPWQLISAAFMIVPVISMFLFHGVEIPEIPTPEKVSGAVSFLKNKTVWLYIVAIFCGGAAECTMSQWASGYLEKALCIPKIWGDVFGVSLFALTLAIGRSLYAKHGKNLMKILVMGAAGASLCYLVCALSSSTHACLAACVLTGICTSMLWPGTLVIASDEFGNSGVLIYALMAAGGDLGASVTPQIIGLITDRAITSSIAASVAQTMSITTEQLGMKLGFLVASLFPLAAVILYLSIKKHRKAFDKN